MKNKLSVLLVVALFIFSSNAFSDEAQNKVILFLGDSLTEGYGIDEDQTYVALLEKEWNEKNLNVEVLNGSVSGSTTSSAMSRLRWFERANLTHVVLALGANDGLRGLSIDKTKENLEEAIDWAIERDIKVILAGMLMPPNYGEDYTEAFKNLYTELATKEGVSLIPFLLEGVAAVDEHNLPDGIHPNEKGHVVIKENVKNHLEENYGFN